MSDLSLAAALRAAQQRVDRLDARLLLQHVLGISHADLIAHSEQSLAPPQQEIFETLLARRALGEPIAYLLGWTEFRRRRFAVSPAVLVPRPETEELLDLALSKLQSIKLPYCLDLGTGSGAIAISLQLECPQARVVAGDVSESALAVASANAASLGAQVDFRLGSWFSPMAVDEAFDLIVSNPPYIAAGDAHLSGDGLRFEPMLALTDGDDGLSCIRVIVAGAARHLKPGGWLIFEHGYDQGEACRNLLQIAGFEAIFTQCDFAGHDRISGGRFMS